MMKFLFSIFTFLIFGGYINAQGRVITGAVFDSSTDMPIEFCNVYVPAELVGTLTDGHGKFSIEIKDEKPKLVFQTFGYKTDTVYITKHRSNYVVRLDPENIELEAVVVTGVTRATLMRENPVSIIAITPKQIETSTESNVIDAMIKNAPGVTTVKTGPNISKPIIHGLGYNRVLTLYDGIRQEGQQYGDEHGLEVDGYNIEKGEVIKGPASLLYGSDAIAGVMSLFPYIPAKNDGKVEGKYIAEYQSNNSLVGNGFRVGYSDEKYIFAIRGSHRLAKNYQNPIDGRVYLTNFKETNFSALAGFKGENGYTHVNFSLYDNHQGIPDGTRDSLTRKFTKQIFDGDDDDIFNRPIVSSSELKSYRIPDLSQRIQHYRAYLHSYYEVGEGDIDIILGGQQNIRREYTHPTMTKQAGMYMRLNTLNYGFRYNAPKVGNVDIATGVNGMLQSNKNMDATDFPIPDYNLYDGGVYLYGKWKKNRWSMSGGLRYDVRYVEWDDFYVGENADTGFDNRVDASFPGAELQFEKYDKVFNGISGSMGGTFQVSRHISLKANVGRAYRSPNITEIGSNGLDPGAHIIYLGNRSFKPEFSFQEDLGISIKYKNFSGDASLFNNNIQNYIYMETVADASGAPVLDAQGNRTNQYQQSSAHLYGAEAWFAIHPEKIEGLRWDNSLSMVYGVNKKSTYKGMGVDGEYLPLMPPFRVMSSLSYEFRPNSTRLLSVKPKFEVEHDAEQNRYLALGGTETRTTAYTLFNFGVNAEFKYYKENRLVLVVQGNNLADKAYQSHLNRLKYFEYYSSSPNGSSGIYNMGRNIAVKLIVSF